MHASSIAADNSSDATPTAKTFGLKSSSKIGDRHLDRLAIVYVRQSTPQQVLENRESRQRQYALAQFAQRLGWPAERVVIIDEDQGHGGKLADHRSGFQRLMTEVSLNHVGIVLGLELSRVSRSNTEWHRLIDVCGIFHTLLCDQDGVYDALDSNDRLLLGMKGAMSEYELITMYNRLLRGSRNKAGRGELFLAVPLGYLKTATGEIIQEPDEQARGMIQLVFEKFEELGSAYAVFRYLVVNDLQLGFRRHRGGRIGELEWRPAVSQSRSCRSCDTPSMRGHTLMAYTARGRRIPRRVEPKAASGSCRPRSWPCSCRIGSPRTLAGIDISRIRNASNRIDRSTTRGACPNAARPCCPAWSSVGNAAAT